MPTIGIATGAGRGMGTACAARLADIVDVLLLVDKDDGSAVKTAKSLVGDDRRAKVEPFPLDVTDREGLSRLSSRVSELGTLRAVAHAAGISPTMADWRQVLTVDLVGTALLSEALLPLTTQGTAVVHFASIAPLLDPSGANPAAEAALDDPLGAGFLERIHEAVGSTIEDSGIAYIWAKRGVQRLVQREATRFGRLGGRVCSVSPGIIDTPMGRQEAATRSTNDWLVEQTPLGREGHADEVAAAVAFLLSNEASFVNGIDIPVDGGVIAALRTAVRLGQDRRRDP
ncbi:SDR family oxidoreductase [Frankia sp. Hr75.2]|nr:SDR family oxidoreductase [Frankia sp. Hr75.2]